MTYTLKSGVIQNPDFPQWTQLGTTSQKLTISPVALAPGSTLSLYFVHFRVGTFVNETCQDHRMEVRVIILCSLDCSPKTADPVAYTVRLAAAL